MSKLADLSTHHLYGAAASTRPSPGGGAVTALTGMLGIGLILKALRISAPKLDDPSRIKPPEAELSRLADALTACADADSAGFEGYIAAAKLPRETDEQKAERSAALSGAAIGAAGAALETLEAAAKALALAREVEPMIGKNIVEDLVGGRELLRVTAMTAIANASANFGAIKDEAEKTRLEARFNVARQSAGL